MPSFTPYAPCYTATDCPRDTHHNEDGRCPGWTRLERVPTSQLLPNDRVHVSGLVVRIPDEGMHQWDHLRPVWSAPGTITNPEYLTTDTGRYLFGGIIPLDGSEPWTIQGNDLRMWTVDRLNT